MMAMEISDSMRHLVTGYPRPGPCVMLQNWNHLLFVHWPIDADLVRRTLPPGLHPDTHQGQAYIGVVPFLMSDVRPNGFPSVKGLSHFPELNLRTYVHDDRGTPGVWFYSLDAAQWIAVRIARFFFHLPYADAKFDVSIDSSPDGRTEYIRYHSRKWNALARKPLPHSLSEFEYGIPGSDTTISRPGTLDYFLIERYVLFSWDRTLQRLHSGRVWHSPYPIVTPKLDKCRTSMFSESELPTQDMPPVHVAYSPGVQVRIFPLRTLD